jgi:hypothetical protein
VLSDLAQGVERYITDRSDIYHPEVAVELKHVVVVAGRGYKVQYGVIGGEEAVAVGVLFLPTARH